MKLSRIFFPALGAIASIAKGAEGKLTATGINAAHSQHLPLHGDFFDSARNFAEIIPQTPKNPVWGPLPETRPTYEHRLKTGIPTRLLPAAERLQKQAAEQEFVRRQREQANRYIDKYGYEKYLEACEAITYYVRETLITPQQRAKFEEVIHELSTPFNATLHRGKAEHPSLPAEARKLSNIPDVRRSPQQEERLADLGHQMVHRKGFSVSASSREEKANTFMEKARPLKAIKYVLEPDPERPTMVFSRDACPLPELNWGFKKRLSRILPSFGEYGDPPALTHYEVDYESELFLPLRANTYKPTQVDTLSDGTSVVTMSVSGKKPA